MRYRDIHIGRFYIVDISDDTYLNDHRDMAGHLYERYQVAKCIHKDKSIHTFDNRIGEKQCILMEFTPNFTAGHDGLSYFKHINKHCYYISPRGIIRNANEQEVDKFMVWLI